MEILMKDFGKMEKKMEREYLSGKMGVFMKENIKMINKMAKEY